eukprot:gene5431-3916_t
MGQLLSRHTGDRDASPLQSLLQAMRWLSGPHQGEAVCACALEGDGVEETYGCHAHLYPTASPGEAHGTMLVWSISRAPLSVFSLLTLCRVGNTCHKDVAVIDESTARGVVLSYRPEL